MARVGSSWGTRRAPRVRRRKGTRPGYWRILSGPWRTKRKAFREARRLRDEPKLQELPVTTPMVVVKLAPRPGRKLPEWWVYTRRKA